MRSVFNGDSVSAWEDEKVLEMDGGDGCTAVGMDVKPLNHAPKNDEFYVTHIVPQCNTNEQTWAFSWLWAGRLMVCWGQLGWTLEGPRAAAGKALGSSGSACKAGVAVAGAVASGGARGGPTFPGACRWLPRVRPGA